MPATVLRRSESYSRCSTGTLENSKVAGKSPTHGVPRDGIVRFSPVGSCVVVPSAIYSPDAHSGARQ